MIENTVKTAFSDSLWGGETLSKLNKALGKANTYGVILLKEDGIKTGRSGSYTKYTISKKAAVTYKYNVLFMKKIVNKVQNDNYYGVSTSHKVGVKDAMRYKGNVLELKRRIFYDNKVRKIHPWTYENCTGYDTPTTETVLDITDDGQLGWREFVYLGGHCVKIKKQKGAMTCTSYEEFLNRFTEDLSLTLEGMRYIPVEPKAMQDLCTKPFYKLCTASKVYAISMSNYFSCRNYNDKDDLEFFGTYGMYYDKRKKNVRTYSNFAKNLYYGRLTGKCEDYTKAELNIFRHIGIKSTWYTRGPGHAWTTIKAKDDKGHPIWIAFDYEALAFPNSTSNFYYKNFKRKYPGKLKSWKKSSKYWNALTGNYFYTRYAVTRPYLL